MQVICVFYSYNEVLDYLEEAEEVYRILNQKYEEEVGFILFGDKIYYEVILKLLKDA